MPAADVKSAQTQNLKSDPGRPRHSIWADAQGLGVGSFLCAYAVATLSALGLITGQTAGLALLLDYAFGGGFALWFLVVSLPFYAAAYGHFGPVFILKSVICIVAVSLMVETLRPLVADFQVPLWLGLLLFANMGGLGFLALIRHGASMGGLGVFALFCQDRFGVRAGHVQMVVDCLIFLAVFFVLEPGLIFYSLLGAIGLNAIIAFNHRRDWYVAR